MVLNKWCFCGPVLGPYWKLWCLYLAFGGCWKPRVALPDGL